MLFENQCHSQSLITQTFQSQTLHKLITNSQKQLIFVLCMSGEDLTMCAWMSWQVTEVWRTWQESWLKIRSLRYRNLPLTKFAEMHLLMTQLSCRPILIFKLWVTDSRCAELGHSFFRPNLGVPFTLMGGQIGKSYKILIPQWLLSWRLILWSNR